MMAESPRRRSRLNYLIYAAIVVICVVLIARHSQGSSGDTATAAAPSTVQITQTVGPLPVQPLPTSAIVAGTSSSVSGGPVITTSNTASAAVVRGSKPVVSPAAGSAAATSAAVASGGVPSATVPSTAVASDQLVDINGITATATKFESVYSSSRYTDSAATRLAALQNCQCVTSGFIKSYEQLLKLTNDPATQAHDRQIQLVVQAQVLNPTDVDLSRYSAAAADAGSPAAVRSLPAMVGVCYTVVQSQVGQSRPDYSTASHELTLVWSKNAWLVADLPEINPAC